MTAKQMRLLEVLLSEPARGFDCAELARLTETSPEGAAMTAASLRRAGLAVRFVGGVGRQRVHYQASPLAIARQAATNHGFDPAIVQPGPGSLIVDVPLR